MNHFIFALIAIELMGVAWIDLRTKKISNFWSLLNIAAAAGLYLFLPQLYPFSWEIIFFPVGFIVIGFCFFLMGIMGAGDSKFLASLFLMIPVEYHLPFFEKLLLTTMVVGGLRLGFKLFKEFRKIKAYLWSQYWQGLKDTIRSRMSYAPVIFLAWLVLGMELWT